MLGPEHQELPGGEVFFEPYGVFGKHFFVFVGRQVGIDGDVGDMQGFFRYLGWKGLV